MNGSEALVFGLLGVLVVTVPAVTSYSTRATCEPNIYCNGKSLDAVMTISGRTVYCDIVTDPKFRCCLPQARHVVCYDIMVDGQFLSYDPTGRSSSTDYTGLCRAITEQRGKQAGKYSTVVTAEGGGYLAYQRGAWVDAEARSQHIKHLACELVESINT